ncbi:pectate lyase superfamily protein-domain-containing protein [Mycena amicta]|nr:pectate lyase superfamily protein-domain-containing protein [Mycena amicta]
MLKLKPTWAACLGTLAFLPSVAFGAGCAGITGTAAPTDPFWMSTPALTSLSKSAYKSGYKVFRNVMTDYHAVGNGIADDTVAINNAISDQGRCGQGCFSSTLTPAIIYFPPGKYRVTAPIIPFYYTTLVGDYNTKPTIVADANFNGIAVIDADPYIPGESNPDGSGVNWWTNQNNFFRSIRNFVIDTTAMSPDVYGTGIHWQVGQATSLMNLDFKMNAGSGTKHQGIFMENGSGGFMSDLTFTGGAFGMWISNQQFTIRNVQITNAVTAVYQLWNWGFTWQNIQISNCQVGFDLNTGGLTLATQSAGGVLIIDSKISSTGIGIRMSSSQATTLGGSLILDNVAFTGITTANIQDGSGTVVAANVGVGLEWFQGNVYLGAATLRGSYTPFGSRPQLLTLASGTYFSRSRPQYQTYAPGQFRTLMSSGLGAKGDGVADDTGAINAFIAQLRIELRMRYPRKVFLSSHSNCDLTRPPVIETGTYLVTDTIFVPAGTQIVGVLYSVIMGSGAKFADQTNPHPVIRVGNQGDVGIVEISDLVITTTGGSAGAIGIEWNLEATSPGAAGLWDVHVRLGGAMGTNINAANCPTSSVNVAKCASAFLGIHITSTGTGYFENVWVWNADHDLDDPNQTRLNVFSGRGILVESAKGPVWLVGTASEHHVIYQYAFNNAQNIYAGLIQTETPYFQPVPIPPAPFSTNALYADPSEAVIDAWGLVITRSFNMFIYGAGLYSFFQNYGQACVPNRNCQNSMVLVDKVSSAVYIYQLTTAGSTNMISYPGNVSVALQADNVDGFASTLTFWEADGTGSPGGNGTGGDGGFGDFSFIPWNPNPIPPAGAVSETFAVPGGPTTVIPIPTTATIVTIGTPGGTATQFVFLDPGGTPVTAQIPTSVSEVNGVTPTWSFNIVPPTAGPITFTGVSGGPTFSSVVPSPSSGATVTVTAPGGASWSLVGGGAAGPTIIGTLPTTVGVSGGITPTPIMPVGWLGPWTDPIVPHTVTTGQPPQVNTDIAWNPNPFPSPGAKSETFVCSGTTTSFAIPTATTTVSAGGATITLNSGGTPVGGPLATQCSEVGGIFPTWSLDIIPPPGAATITFTGPLTGSPTYISAVIVPPKTDSPDPSVTGPPGDKNRCDSTNIWQLFFNAIIHPCLPLDIGIIGGITPVPIKPPGWTGSWSNPIPRQTPPPPGGNPDDDNDTTSASQSSSSTSSGSCPTQPADLTLPDDPANADWDGQGTDPDRRRKRARSRTRNPRESPAAKLVALGRSIVTAPLRWLSSWRRAAPTPEPVKADNATHMHTLVRRNRRVNIPRCAGVMVVNPVNVLLGAADYVKLDPAGGIIGTTLVGVPVGGSPVGQVTNQEHVFELGYIGQWVGAAPMSGASCTWVSENLIDYVRADGSTMGVALVQAIDREANMVWVDKPLNQAKSNVVNQNSAGATNPPMAVAITNISTIFATFQDASDEIYRLEFFLRNLAALGQYFAGTSQIFEATAQRVQDLLSEITPNDVLVNDASIPLMFNTWLTNLINTYPNGCTSRANNAYAFYRASMQRLAARVGTPVPSCYPLYALNTYNPSSFTARLLLPPAPNSPRCNVPGTGGVLTYTEVAQAGAQPAVGIFQWGNNNNDVQMMGSGNTDFYAIGTGPSISGNHIQGRDLSSFSDCPNSFLFNDVPPNTALYQTANIDFTCGNGLGAQDVGITWVMNGRQLPACILIRASASSPWEVLCSPTAAETTACAEDVLLLNGARKRAPPLQPLSMAISSLDFSVLGGL